MYAIRSYYAFLLYFDHDIPDGHPDRKKKTKSVQVALIELEFHYFPTSKSVYCRVQKTWSFVNQLLHFTSTYNTGAK